MANSSEQLNKKGDTRGLHTNSLKNLEDARGKGFTKGKSGNHNGSSLTTLVKQLLKDVPDIQIAGKRNTKRWRQLIAQAWLVGAYQGNPTYFKELLERIEGKVAQPITGAEGTPLIPPVTVFKFADGTEFKPPRNGHKSVKAMVDGNGDTTSD